MTDDKEYDRGKRKIVLVGLGHKAGYYNYCKPHSRVVKKNPLLDYSVNSLNINNSVGETGDM